MIILWMVERSNTKIVQVKNGSELDYRLNWEVQKGASQKCYHIFVQEVGGRGGGSGGKEGEDRSWLIKTGGKPG